MDVATWVPLGLLLAVLVAGGVSDWRTGQIPNHLTYGAILAGLVFWTGWGLAMGGWRGAGLAAAAAGLAFLAGFVPGMVAFTLGGLGGGDVKLLGAVGALSADWRLTLTAAVYAVVLAAVMAIVVMIRQRIVMRTLQRLLSVAMATAARVRSDLPQDSPKIPFGVALAIGGMVAAAEYLLDVKLPWH